MTDSRHSRIGVPILAAIIAGVAILAIAIWFMRSGSSKYSGNAGPRNREHAAQADPIARLGGVGSALRIPEQGRLSLDADSLPAEGKLTLFLDLPDEARGHDSSTIRIVSTDGRRIETTASPLAGAGTGVQLEIDSDFLSRGRYMIEIETVEPTPLQVRRYVLDLE